MWSSYLPRTDPFLARTLFTSARKTLRFDSSNLHRLLFKSFVETFLTPTDDDLPWLFFIMSPKKEYTLINMPRRVLFYPVVATMLSYTPVDAVFHPQDLEREIRVRKHTEEDGNWKNHSLCILAIDCVEVTWRWYRNIHVGGEDVTRSLRMRKMKRGIIVGAFVEVMRDLLSFAVAGVKRFADKLECRTCDRCRDDDYDNETKEEFESSDGQESSEGEEMSEDENESEYEDEDEYGCDCGHCT